MKSHQNFSFDEQQKINLFYVKAGLNSNSFYNRNTWYSYVVLLLTHFIIPISLLVAYRLVENEVLYRIIGIILALGLFILIYKAIRLHELRHRLAEAVASQKIELSK